MKKYDVVYADPAWEYGDTTKNKLGSNKKHYPSMAHQEMAKIDVAGFSSQDATLFMWTTAKMLPVALSLFEAWGFTYKTVAFVWLKTTPKGNPVAVMTMWTHSCVEFCLVGTRGKHKRVGLGVKQLIMEPRREHSRKPDSARQRIVELMGDVPRIELFARTKTPGWAVWGNEVNKFTKGTKS